MKAVYFFRQIGSNLVRIGTTSNVFSRFKSFDENSPSECLIVGYIETNRAEDIFSILKQTELKGVYSPKEGFYKLNENEVTQLQWHCSDLLQPEWKESLKQVISEHAGKRLSNTQIQELLQAKGVHINHVQLGRSLTALGLKKRQARINGKVRLCYHF